ncbi:MAG TPA: penicillin-binding protein 2 [Candidatus Saccharimonadales bacterium]
MQPKASNDFQRTIARSRVLFTLLVLVVSIFVVKLFYMQVIRYSYYHTAALSDQLAQHEIPATRGLIEAHQGNSIVPIVLNQTLYTMYADPTMIKNVSQVAGTLASVLGGNEATFAAKLQTKNTRYVVLAQKVTQVQETALLKPKYPGLGGLAQDYRTYPDGSLASQLLGFVNNNGKGEYGIEQYLNGTLAGTPGELKAVTDINGVPLAADSSNTLVAPKDGSNVVLSINMGMQEQMEQILQSEYQKTKSQGISAIIMDPSTGKIASMANYPTYDPSNYSSVSDPTLFQNAAVTNAIEPGSTMKTLTTSAALDTGSITPNETFFDPAHWVVDNFNITDIEQDGGARQQSIASILALSLNTGATWELMQMSQLGGTTINDKGIQTWHDYMVNHYRLGQETGIEQGYEETGYVPPANMSSPAISLTYAETSFGQGVTLTAVQLASALSSVLNGGTYYQPSLVDETISADGKTTTDAPKVLEKNVVSSKVGPELVPLMQNVVTTYLHEGFGFMNFPSNFLVGGKTGTAQIAQPGGGYYANLYNGTYVGFVGGTVNKPQYVIVVYNIKPNVTGYAGSYGGQPVFADLAHMLINDGYATPMS